MPKKYTFSNIFIFVPFIFIVTSFLFIVPQSRCSEVNNPDKKGLSEGLATLQQLKLNDSENYKFNEIAIVVEDIKKAVAYYQNAFGLHFEGFKEYTINAIEKGKPNSYTQVVAFAKLGPIEVELIQVIKGNSIHTDFLKAHGEGIHHLGFKVGDLEKEMKHAKSMGLELISFLDVAGVKVFAYYEKTNGVLIELVQENVREKISAAMKATREKTK